MRSRIVICPRQIAFVPNAGQAMLVPTAENDRFRFFRRGSVVDPCGRVALHKFRQPNQRFGPSLRYAPLRGAAFRHVGAAYFNPPAGRPQILNSPFSIFNYTAGLGAEQFQKSKYFSKTF